MLRRFVFILTLMLLVSGAASASDPAEDWMAWLRYGRHMTQINAAGGNLRGVDLPLPDDKKLGDQLAVSEDGEVVAYGVSQDGTSGQEVVIYNLYHKKLITRYALPDQTRRVNLSQGYIFDDTGSAIAFGLSTADSTSPDFTHWQIVVLDLSSGEALHTLDRSKTIDSIMGGVLGDWNAYVRRFHGSEVEFTLERFGMSFYRQGFVWDTATGDVREDVAYPDLYTDTFLPTGEVLSAVDDPRLPRVDRQAADNSDPDTNNPPFNSIQVYDPVQKARFPIYASYGRPAFVQNGERVLIQSDNDNDQDFHELWTLVERDGMVLDERTFPSDTRILDVASVPDGFIYVTASPATQYSPSVISPAIFLLNTREDNNLSGEQVAWSLTLAEYYRRAGGNDVPLEIVWIHSDVPVGPFMSWKPLIGS